MARILDCDAQTRLPLIDWQHLRIAPDAHMSPATLPDAGWLPFAAPGLFGPDAAGRLAELDDHWLRLSLAAPLDGLLLFEGLASHCDVFLEGKIAAQHRSMFTPLALEVTLPAGAEICLRFHALEGALKAAPRRARWRPMMIEPNGLRHLRTTALGSMDGWTPEGRPTGPYRAICALNSAPGRITQREIADIALSAALCGEEGRLAVSLALKPGIGAQHGSLTCAGKSVALNADAAGRLGATLALPGIEKWWPHTHGTPALHDVSVTIDGSTFDLGQTGFRRIEVDRGEDGRGFGLVVNGVPVFCRGAVWMTPDAARLPGDAASYAQMLALAQEAGMNMLRVPGVGVYESEAFFARCDQLGILVMQDVMLANFDYPQADEGFAGALEAEVVQLLSSTQVHPSLAVLCGGSEVFQQAAMLGAPPGDWSGPVFDALLPRAIAQQRPGLIYVPNSPSGGALPFVVNEGVGHYFGVGAYLRPLEDARRAQVRFASECLAFANVGCDPALMNVGVPRDAGADWDFADVRNHYARLLFGDAAQEATRAHGMAQAASAHVMEASFHEWRRAGSPTRGALVLALSNLMPGAGWGVIDETGAPKAAYYALRRAFRPLHLGLTDEGVNGLYAHLVNESAEAFSGTLVIEAYREGRIIVASGRKDLDLAPREAVSLSGFAVLGSFFDLTYAYRFGAREHDSVHVRLIDGAGALAAEAFHFPDTAALAPETLGLGAILRQDEHGWFLDVSTGRLARFVAVECAGYIAQDQGFHLAPGTPRRIGLRARGADTAPPQGVLRALNGADEARFGS